MTGYLITTNKMAFIGPHAGLLYKSREGAQNALNHWPGLSDSRVVKVRVTVISER